MDIESSHRPANWKFSTTVKGTNMVLIYTGYTSTLRVLGAVVNKPFIDYFHDLQEDKKNLLKPDKDAIGHHIRFI